MSCYNSTVPDSAPINIMVMSAHPGALNVSWDPPPEIDQNGPITGYVIRYSRVESNITMDEIITSGSIYRITELLPFVNYSVEIAAINVNGTGPYSDPVIGLSGHEGKEIVLWLFVSDCMNIKEIIFNRIIGRA